MNIDAALQAGFRRLAERFRRSLLLIVRAKNDGSETVLGTGFIVARRGPEVIAFTAGHILTALMELERRPNAPRTGPFAKRLKSADVGASFALRDIYNKGWSGLATREDVAAAVGVLIDYDWLSSSEETTPGRTRTVYRVNPAVLPRPA